MRVTKQELTGKSHRASNQVFQIMIISQLPDCFKHTSCVLGVMYCAAVCYFKQVDIPSVFDQASSLTQEGEEKSRAGLGGCADGAVLPPAVPFTVVSLSLCHYLVESTCLAA